MCGRFSLMAVGDVLGERYEESLGNIQFEEGVKAQITKRYNIAPTQDVPVIIGNNIALLRWGLIPHWAKHQKIGYKMINARAESIEEKSAYGKPFRTQRCLVPATGFYEWKNKIPYHFQLKSQDIFSFAGIWDSWSNNGQEIMSFSIITTDANPIVKEIHDRMPVILSKDEEKYWLEEHTNEELKRILKPYNGDMKKYQVSKMVNSPKEDKPEMVEPVSQQTTLF